MSVDFDKIVASILAEGGSAEDAAKQFSDALNKAREAIKKKVPTRETFITGIEDIFDKHVKTGHLDLSDAAACVFLAIVQDTEDGKKITSIEELNDLLNFITEDLEGTLDKWKFHKAVEPFFEDFSNLFSIKRKDKRRGTDRKVQTDEEKIKEFLRNIFS